MPKNQAQSGAEGAGTPPRKGVLRTLEAVLEKAAGRIAGWLRRHALDLATGLAVVGGLFLLYAETLDLYRVVTPGGVTSNAAGSIPSRAQTSTRGLWGVIGVVIGAAALLGRWTRQRLPAWAAVGAGGAGARHRADRVDLPDVTSFRAHDRDRDRRGATGGRIGSSWSGALAALGGAAGLAGGLSRNAAVRR